MMVYQYVHIDLNLLTCNNFHRCDHLKEIKKN